MFIFVNKMVPDPKDIENIDMNLLTLLSSLYAIYGVMSFYGVYCTC